MEKLVFSDPLAQRTIRNTQLKFSSEMPDDSNPLDRESISIVGRGHRKLKNDTAEKIPPGFDD